MKPDAIALQAERRILLLRSQRVMLDSDLAELYGVETKALNRAVKRNLDRFPEDFAFQLTGEEFEDLRCQFGTTNRSGPIALRSQIGTSKLRKGSGHSQSMVTRPGRGGRRYLPYAFTEQGVAMLSSVLRSTRAVQVNIAIMRAFVRLRELLSTHADLARKLAEMERRYDSQFKVVFDAIRQLMTPPDSPKRRIGFNAE